MLGDLKNHTKKFWDSKKPEKGGYGPTLNKFKVKKNMDMELIVWELIIRPLQ